MIHYFSVSPNILTGPVNPCMMSTSSVLVHITFSLISVVYCCVINCPKIVCLKTTNIYCLTHFPWVRSSSAGEFWFRILLRSQTRCHLRLQLSKSLPGSRGSTSNRTDSYAWQANAHCWQETSVLHCVVVSVGLVECPHDMAAGVPSDWAIQERARYKLQGLFALALEVTHYHFQNILVITQIHPI